ncbi:hypothetical protein EU538_10560, partial [Candidatus Thorarchaeota archaeon]
MTVEEMRWDLTQLVKDSEPDSIVEEMNRAVDEARKLRDEYRGKIDQTDADGLLRVLERKDEMELEFEGPFMFSSLMYSADSTTDTAKRLFDTARNAGMKIGQAMAFLDLEIGELLSEKPEIVDDPKLSEYNHYLKRIKRRIPHMLSEKEEQLIITKDKNGINAWQQLQGDWLSTRTFDIEIDGEKKTMPYGEIIGLYQHTDRDVRKRANKTVYEGLGEDDILWASAIRSVCSDHLQMCQLRNYESSMTQSLIANDVHKEAIDALMETIEANVDLYRDYLRMKAKMMNLKRLGNWDIVAPLPNAPEKKYGRHETRDEVVGAYTSFDAQVGQWVDEMFEKHHIDSEVRKGKRSGAFCASWLAGKSAYILSSFNGQLGDVFTLA